MPDARGHGRSGGEGMDLGWYGDLDTTAAVELPGAPGGRRTVRIGVVGLSMGGEEAIGAADRPRVRAVVAEGATGRTPRTTRTCGPTTGRRPGARARRYIYGLTDLLTDASPPASLRIRRGGRHRVPARHRRHDRGGGRVAADGMRSVAPSRVEVWTVPGAGHAGGSPPIRRSGRTGAWVFLEQQPAGRGDTRRGETTRRAGLVRVLTSR